MFCKALQTGKAQPEGGLTSVLTAWPPWKGLCHDLQEACEQPEG